MVNLLAWLFLRRLKSNLSSIFANPFRVITRFILFTSPPTPLQMERGVFMSILTLKGQKKTSPNGEGVGGEVINIFSFPHLP
jgi:hypothetical protein